MYDGNALLKHFRSRQPCSLISDFLLPAPLRPGAKCMDCDREIKEDETYYRLKKMVEHITCYRCVWDHQPKED